MMANQSKLIQNSKNQLKSNPNATMIDVLMTDKINKDGNVEV